MFSSLKSKIMLGVYVFLLISIPVGAYLASQNQNPISKAREVKKSPSPIAAASPVTSARTSALDELKNATSPTGSSDPLTSSEASNSGSVSFGPTLSLKIALEGRPEANQTTRLFVGIADAAASTLKYLLSFTVDVPADGTFNGISLAGLTPGTSYKAILKGPAQLATSSAFTMSPSITTLNNGGPVTLLTGDVNEDNVINTADYALIKAALGTRSSSANWNSNLDFNKDDVVNTIDLGLLIKNFGKTGETGVWQSTPQTSTASGSLTPPNVGSATSSATTSATPNPPAGAANQTDGYWFWMPKI